MLFIGNQATFQRHSDKELLKIIAMSCWESSAHLLRTIHGLSRADTEVSPAMPLTCVWCKGIHFTTKRSWVWKSPKLNQRENVTSGDEYVLLINHQQIKSATFRMALLM